MERLTHTIELTDFSFEPLDKSRPTETPVSTIPANAPLKQVLKRKAKAMTESAERNDDAAPKKRGRKPKGGGGKE